VQVVGAPLAAGLLQLDGHAGLRGWQWLFVAEGVPTLLLGVFMPFLLPSEPKSAPFLSSSEAEALAQEVAACRSDNSVHGHSITDLLRMALQNKCMYILGVVKFAKDFTTYGCMFWAPMLIRGLLHKHQRGDDGCSSWDGPDSDVPETGYNEVLLTGIPYTFAAFFALVVAWNSQARSDPLVGPCVTCTSYVSSLPCCV
jgi:MFS family permease